MKHSEQSMAESAVLTMLGVGCLTGIILIGCQILGIIVR